jgi:hypothetical protein
MPSERQIAANRLNALKSTGPRTGAGKSRSSKNAYKHGLSGVIGAEIEIAANELLTVLRSEYPQVSPALLVKLAIAAIDMRRAQKVYAEKLNKFGQALARDEHHSNVDVAALDKADRYVRRALSRKSRLMRQVSFELSTDFGKTNPI